ncbi:MAG: polymer-forming cytoskeletal protein [Gammaproteobacteria bacterium]|nr:polymer-forming cytoskeletal protein [Gammaproteobacteria bacterium]NNC97050.1 polymer-forming cytoskeletal protein [Gammaproteobacteria bacterium]
MFGSKTTNTGNKPKSTNTPTRNIDTLIGQNTRITGDIEFAGGLHIDGIVNGNIVANQSTQCVLRISDKGLVEGNVNVPHVVLNGTVKGDVIANEKVELGSSARVIGNVYYSLIEMAMGAEINGQLIHQPAKQKKTAMVSGAKPADSNDNKLSAVK